MASISVLQMTSGNWRALVRHPGCKPACKTHATKGKADTWARARAAEFEAGEAAPDAVTVGALIQAYRAMREKSRPIADTSTAHYTLRYLERILGNVDARKLDTEDLLGYCHKRSAEGAGPYTLNMDLSQLSTALRYAASALSLKLPDSVGGARPLLKHLGLIGDGGKRERRPTRDEIERLEEYLRVRHGGAYADAMLFAIASAMRAGEICRIRWADVDREKKTVVVRDRKDPRKKKGNDEVVPLLRDAWTVANRQPAGERIFAIEPATLSRYFTEACADLGIPDLHFHDLRHEGTSQMFEAGMDIPEVALVTGHKKWDSLRRYTQLKPENLHR